MEKFEDYSRFVNLKNRWSGYKPRMSRYLRERIIVGQSLFFRVFLNFSIWLEKSSLHPIIDFRKWKIRYSFSIFRFYLIFHPFRRASQPHLSASLVNLKVSPWVNGVTPTVIVRRCKLSSGSRSAFLKTCWNHFRKSFNLAIRRYNIILFD